MQVRRIALAVGLLVLMGAGFKVAFTHPELFFAPLIQATPETAAFAPLQLTPTELKARLDQGDRLIIADVRGKKSYDREHIEGSRSMPASEISSWGPKLLPDELVVFYCS